MECNGLIEDRAMDKHNWQTKIHVDKPTSEIKLYDGGGEFWFS